MNITKHEVRNFEYRVENESLELEAGESPAESRYAKAIPDDSDLEAEIYTDDDYFELDITDDSLDSVYNDQH